MDVDEQGLNEPSDVLKAATASLAESAKFKGYRVNVADEQSIQNAFRQVVEDYGRIDYVVNCAGIAIFGRSSLDVMIEEFDRLNAINYRGVWLCMREALQIMQNQTLDCEAYPEAQIPDSRAQRGSIVSMSSVGAYKSIPGSSAYCGAKSGVVMLTKSEALDFADKRIRVNCVLPGVINTPMAARSFAQYKAAKVEVSKPPMGRIGLPEEVADVIVFLSGNKASYVTGADWTVDGGILTC